MKKIYLFFLAITLCLSCSKEDEAGNNTTSINPPTWIHGTWEAEGASGTSMSGFRFTADDIILLSSFEISHKNQIKDYRQQGVEVTVTENISPQEYDIKITYPMGTSVNYSFSKIDGSTLTWKSTGYGDLELQKQ